ncbi:hypothetical protein HII31_04497 [Pseudocercospora fuligena]|uniref:Microtubule associated protein n=1 Tax=Pseudocercospora fuligena TaxID=685502 RepID=A0A8H6RNA0_9PEZI|nr:hypothetical protein HII31_04497 [Pseudocercospora fuligena]
MAVYKHNPNPNRFVRTMRHIYNPIGFQKGYNFILFFIFGGALLGFCLARASYMNVNQNFIPAAGPGESYWYKQDWYNIGIHIHLLTCIPAGLLAPFQFLPVIRHKLLLFHRLNGYLIILLILITNIGALMIARRAFSGTLATQSGVGLLAILTTTSTILAYINIKRLQIEQHRAWMLRTWSYMGTIITTRIIMIISTQIITRIGSYYIAMPCKQIEAMGGDIEHYLTCSASEEAWTVVHADFAATNGIQEIAATFQLTFGMSIWLSIALHAVGVELYLHLTKAETERLRRVSYERQVERGMRRPGSAGLTTDRFGDEEEWVPPVKKVAGTMGDEDKLGVNVVDDDSSSGISKPPSALGWDRS